jgi:small subunit ribosomal protein S2
MAFFQTRMLGKHGRGPARRAVKGLRHDATCSNASCFDSCPWLRLALVIQGIVQIRSYLASVGGRALQLHPNISVPRLRRLHTRPSNMILRRALQSCPRALARGSRRQAQAPPSRCLSTEAESTQLSADSPLKQPQSPTTEQVAAQYRAFKETEKHMGTLGAAISPHFQPHTLLNHPPSPADVTLELLLASEAHQGHVTALWNPANARYIHGIRQGVHIISLEVTAAHLRRSAKVVQEVCRKGGMVLFVGTRDGQDRAVAKAAELARGYHLFERWIPGSITNGQQILGRCKTKVVNELDEEVPGFEEQLYDRPVLRPDLVVCVNPLENYVLLHECALNNIPTIGVIDTNADPTWVTYPIPANDDR